MFKKEPNVFLPESIPGEKSDVVDVTEPDVPAQRHPDTCQWKHSHKRCKRGDSKAGEVLLDDSEVAEMDVAGVPSCYCAEAPDAP